MNGFASPLAQDYKIIARAQQGHHDANLLTLHRVRNFRALAMDIRPRA